MEMRVLIGFLLVCAVAGFSVEETSSNDIFTPTDYALFGDSVSYVYDDDENLVRLSFDDEGDDGESVKETAMDLSKRVFFLLYSSNNPTTHKPIYLNDETSLKNSNFDPKKPTRFVTHGWINSGKSLACSLVRDAYIAHGDYNVIVIDWSSITLRPYIWASKRVKIVGHYVSSMLNFLEKHGMDMSQTLLVGHSLGAHVVGIGARHAKGTVNHVVGLDPALPGFALAGPGSRISSGDAKYVEIIHTNGGFLGFLAAIGDSDFYPNGGSNQLGCLNIGACSHARSYRFFAESINSPVGFHGKNCDSYLRYKLGFCKRRATSLMGGHKSLLKATGKFYLRTNPKFPFARGI